MRTPRLTFEALVAAAEELLAGGHATVDELKEHVGGGSRDRLRQALKHATEEKARREAAAIVDDATVVLFH